MTPPGWFDSYEYVDYHLDLRQFIDWRESTLPNGMRIIDVHNSSGLTFTLLPDRGLDIWSAHYNGMPLTWIAPGSPLPPDYGQSWLRLFNGGLLTTCGLTHAGPPETDDLTGEQRDLHGNYTRLRAHTIRVEKVFEYSYALSGTLTQSRLFGEQLLIEREYIITIGHAAIDIRTYVQNIGDTPTPLMLLYHCNLGYPLVREGTELMVASDVYPRDDAARAGADSWQIYDAATPRYAEQVFFHHVRHSDNRSHAALVNNDIGLKFSWNTTQLPYLTQWKNTRQGIYVNGVEPGNCIPEGQNAARDSGRLVMLDPGDSKQFSLTFTILDGQDAIDACREEINTLKTEGTPVADCRLSGYDQHT